MYHEVTASNLVAVDIDGRPGAAHRACGQPRRLRHPQRDPRPRRPCALRDAHPHHHRHGGGLPGAGAVARLVLRRAAARPGGLPRVRGHHRQPRRAQPHAEEHRRQALRDPAQPRPAELGPRHPRGLHVAVDAAARLRRAGGVTQRRRDACRHAPRRARSACARPARWSRPCAPRCMRHCCAGSTRPARATPLDDAAACAVSATGWSGGLGVSAGSSAGADAAVQRQSPPRPAMRRRYCAGSAATNSRMNWSWRAKACSGLGSMDDTRNSRPSGIRPREV